MHSCGDCANTDTTRLPFSWRPTPANLWPWAWPDDLDIRTWFRYSDAYRKWTL